MKNKLLFLAITSLILSIILCMKQNRTPLFENATISSPAVSTISDQGSGEMRAVWVPFMALDMAFSDYSESAFRAKFDNIVKIAKMHNLNALIVHVRAFCDALYPSDFYPWSHLVSKEPGTCPGFDPLDYMVTATHKAHMQFHALINPFRLQLHKTPAKLCDSSIFYKFKNDTNAPSDIILETESGKYLNPGYCKVRELIINGVSEIVRKYPIDGIQFDDYFYPPDLLDLDLSCYNTYCSTPGNDNPLPIDQWRMANINNLVCGTYSAIKSINPSVVFGISPQCNIDNDLRIGADVISWCSSPGYIDYICPQTYVSLSHPVLPFCKSVSQWKSLTQNCGIKLYFGLAAYKAGSDADSGTWKDHNDILKTQVEHCRQVGCDGFMIFSISDLESARAQNEILNVMSVFN